MKQHHCDVSLGSLRGGVFVETDQRQDNKMPGLGNIPVPGHPFKNSKKERATREILLFITPRIKK